jgi:2-acylglycerol O-acyltransferase 2
LEKDNTEQQGINHVLKFLLKDRKGFCKLALQHGVSLVPVISMEEHMLFDLIQLPSVAHKFQLYLQKHVLGFAPVMVWGNKWPFMPKRHELNVFVGKPIHCDKIEHPTDEQIDSKHQEYCHALDDMFQQCKQLVKGCENWELEFVGHPFHESKDRDDEVSTQ